MHTEHLFRVHLYYWWALDFYLVTLHKYNVPNSKSARKSLRFGLFRRFEVLIFAGKIAWLNAVLGQR